MKAKNKEGILKKKVGEDKQTEFDVTKKKKKMKKIKQQL